MPIDDLIKELQKQGDAASNQALEAVFSIDSKQSVRLLLTEPDGLSGLGARQGVDLVAGDRVVATGQGNPVGNGIYITATGAWSRARDYSNEIEITPGSFFYVEEGEHATEEWSYVGGKLGPGDVGKVPLLFGVKKGGPANGGLSDQTKSLLAITTTTQAALDAVELSTAVDAVVVGGKLDRSMVLTAVSPDARRKMEVWADQAGGFRAAMSVRTSSAAPFARQPIMEMWHSRNLDPFKGLGLLKKTDDLNTLLATGWHTVATGGIPRNYPTGLAGGGVVEVFVSDDGSEAVQRVFDYASTAQFNRGFRALPTPKWGEWSTDTSVEWARVLNKPNTLAGYGITDSVVLYAGQIGFADDLDSSKFQTPGWFTMDRAVTADQVQSCPINGPTSSVILEVFVYPNSEVSQRSVTQRVTEVKTHTTFVREKVGLLNWTLWKLPSILQLGEEQPGVELTPDANADDYNTTGTFYAPMPLTAEAINFPSLGVRILNVNRSVTAPIGTQVAIDPVTRQRWRRYYLDGVQSPWELEKN